MAVYKGELMKFAYKNAFQELLISLRGRVTNINVVKTYLRTKKDFVKATVTEFINSQLNWCVGQSSKHLDTEIFDVLPKMSNITGCKQ